MSGSGIKSTLSPNASPFVPKNFALPVVATAPPFAAAAAPTAAVPDSDMSYALSANVQTIYVTGLPGYYAPYVPTPAVPFYTMQYQCLYQPTPPMGVCCPMEEGMPAVADEPPPTLTASPTAASMQQQPVVVQNARGKKKKNRNGRRRDTASSHRDSCEFTSVAELRSSAGAARGDREEWQGGGVASPDFSSSSEFPSLPVQDLPQRQSPSGISYSTALQQHKAPQPTSGLVASREASSSRGNVRGLQQCCGSSSSNNDTNRHHKRGSGSRKHRRGGEGGKRAEDGEPSTRCQQERRGPKKGAKVASIDGGAEKHQFEAPEKDVKSELRHQVDTIATNGSRAGSGRTPHQNGVRVNATRGRRETRHSSLLRGVLKGDRYQQQQQQQQGSHGGRKELDATSKEEGEEGCTLQDGSPRHEKNEYPPLGPDLSPEQTPQARTAKDVVAKAGDNVPKQQQPSFREKGSKPSGPVKPLASTNGGSGAGPKHKTAISMTIADIIVPKQRQPKKLKEKENLLERSTKKPEVRGRPVANQLDSSAPSKKRGKERETPARRKLSVMKKIVLKEREERRQRQEKLQLASAARQSLLDSAIPRVVVDLDDSPVPESGGLEEGDPAMQLPLPQAAADLEKRRLHSTRFRDYCDHVQTSEINITAKTLLTDLVFFQDRLYQKDPIKARSKRRLVYGLKEVHKYLLLNKLKCIIFAPDIEEVKAEGGLDHSLSAIIEYAQAHFVPTVFALKRRLLGKLAKKSVAVSCVGIFDYSAREAQFKQLLELVNVARKTYAALKEELADSGSTAGLGQDDEKSQMSSALLEDSTQHNAALDDGWVTTNEDSDTEDLEDSLAAAKAKTSANTDTVTRFLALALRTAGHES
ncbi:SECIS-binding protein 2 isoform X3 [Amblyomma americanum]